MDILEKKTTLSLKPMGRVTETVADPGFPVGGGVDLGGGGRGLLRQLHFENFVCQNERFWTLGGGGRAPGICQ